MRYHFHLRLQIPKFTPLTAKKIEVRAQSTAMLGKVHGDIQKNIAREQPGRWPVPALISYRFGKPQRNAVKTTL